MAANNEIVNDGLSVFRCKQFEVVQSKSIMKVNSDGMLLGAWSEPPDRCNILDIGTGTGIIALMLAQRTKSAVIHGVEVDPGSAEEAAYNFEMSPWRKRMKCYGLPIQEYSRTAVMKYDLIVSNPPFFSGGTFSLNENRKNVRHTTRLSHGDLLISVSRLLSLEGRFDLILPYIEGERFIELSERYNLFENRVTCLRSKVGKPVERLLISLSRKKGDLKKRDEIIMYADDPTGAYTEDYRKLTRDFYLNF